MDIEATIIDQEERLRVAQLKSNTDELTLLIDNSLVFSALDGIIIGKDQDLNMHRSPDFRINKMDVINREIKCLENAAIVNVLMDTVAVISGAPQSNIIRYIRVWHKFSDGWRIISGSMRPE